MKKFTKLVSLLLVALVMLFAVTGCSKKSTKEPTTTAAPTKAEITISVDVVKSDKSTKNFKISTTASNLEDALVGEKLVEGEDSEYGLYITTVDGEKADYNANKSFWGLYKDEESLTTGAKNTKIADGDHYKLVYTIAE